MRFPLLLLLFSLLALLPSSWGILELAEQQALPAENADGFYGYFGNLDGNLLVIGTLASQFVYICDPTCALVSSVSPSGFYPIYTAGGYVAIANVDSGELAFMQCDSLGCTAAGTVAGAASFFPLLAGSGSFFAIADGFEDDVEIFECNSGSCVFHSTLTTGSTHQGLSMTGNYLAVAHSDTEVSLFEFTTTWNLMYTFTAPGTSFSVAIDFPLLAVGDHAFSGGQGRVSVYTCDAVSCTLLEDLFGSAINLIDFGYSVQLSGDNLLISAPDTTLNNGEVHLYTCTSSCELQSTVDYAAIDPSGLFGYVTSLSGNRAMVGVPYSHASNGAVVIYTISLVGCPAGVYDHASYQRTDPFETARGVCLTGYKSVDGMSFRDCFAGNIWSSKPTSRCLTVKCLPDLIEDRLWPLKGNRRTSKKPCPPGQVGKITRKCLVTGLWGPENNYCRPA